MISQDQIKIIRTTLSKFNPIFIILFGSYAKGTARKDSDIDIAFFTQTDISDYERFLTAQQLAENLQIESVDLVDIRKVDTVFAAQIFYTGEVIFCKDENEFILQRIRALSMYTDLNECRKKVLERIKESGSVYEQ
ncbi:type VII toxin-antitoxin system MntA family adenylyltransferase antitoxin [Pseudogracilibacillus sp. SO30301A]|uniref:type VII toxin-antitoxin system MntA family adenylyltransferase antitoxin n=1 Tax=Pseudogracilibacillus sp. SO30301A TaxID=3098291 RepID=UPI00300E64E3